MTRVPIIPSSSGGSSTPRMDWNTDFPITTRFNKQASGGVNTFNADGLNVDTTATGSRWAHTRFDVGASWGNPTGMVLGSPAFSARFFVGAIGTDVLFVTGLGEMINDIAGGTQSCISKHFGFKITRVASGAIQLWATQANGTTETASLLDTVAVGNEIEVILKVTTGTSATYYYRKNGGALSAGVTLSTNMPATAENWVNWGIQNNAVATQSTIYLFNSSFSRG